MGLFFDVLSAINNPNQQGSVAQLGAIANTIQQVSRDRGISPTDMQSLLSVAGNVMRPALQQQRGILGGHQLENLVAQGVGGTNGVSSLTALLPPQLQQQIVQTVAQKTGLNASMLQAAVPTILPAILGLLNMGASKPGTAGVKANPLLSAFLDSDRDGDADLGDVMKFASRFLSPAHA